MRRHSHLCGRYYASQKNIINMAYESADRRCFLVIAPHLHHFDKRLGCGASGAFPHSSEFINILTH